jgi:hypothetical protein
MFGRSFFDESELVRKYYKRSTTYNQDERCEPFD